MNYTEETAVFACAGNAMLGIVTKPELPLETGVVVIVGGPQYRVGSHRQFVLLSRALASVGYPVMRFDYQGMGDSQGEQKDFESVSPDIAAAIGALLKQVPEVKQVVLWGLCDGASAALLYCHETQDPRVSGLCLLNPWVRSEASLAKTQVKHYYAQRLKQKEFWLKLVTGQVAWSALRELRNSLATVLSKQTHPASVTTKLPFQTQMALAWKNLNRPILLLLSGNDYTAKEFLEYTKTDVNWSGAYDQPSLQQCNLPAADHTCSSAAWRTQVETRVIEWLSLSRSW